MTDKYELCITDFGDKYIKWDDNGTIRFIPVDDNNSDYQRYLNPEAEQSTPIVTSDE